jgi:hypothetical protein
VNSKVVPRAETRLVQRNVIVENKKGFRAEHLKKEDFTFFNDGKPQGIALFSTESATPLEASPAKTESRTAPAPNVFGKIASMPMKRPAALPSSCLTR